MFSVQKSRDHNVQKALSITCYTTSPPCSQQHSFPADSDRDPGPGCWIACRYERLTTAPPYWPLRTGHLLPDHCTSHSAACTYPEDRMRNDVSEGEFDGIGDVKVLTIPFHLTLRSCHTWHRISLLSSPSVQFSSHFHLKRIFNCIIVEQKSRVISLYTNLTIIKQGMNMIIPKPEFIIAWLKITKSIFIIFPLSVNRNGDLIILIFMWVWM